MIYYNYEKLGKLLNSLALLLGTKVSMYDENFKPTGAHGSTQNDFCSLINKVKLHACANSDLVALNRCVHEENIYYHCHFGFIEIMIKTMINNTPLYVCIGPFRDPKRKKKDFARIKEFSELAKVDYKTLVKQYMGTPEFSIDKYNSISGLTNVLVEHAKETKIIAIKDDLFDSEIAPFLKEHIAENYTILELCDIFAVPQKKFHAVVKKAAGLSPKQYITKLKIDKAYEDIILTRKDLQEIASEIGIEDYNYFIKLFKSLKGHTPKYFRKESEQRTG